MKKLSKLRLGKKMISILTEKELGNVLGGYDDYDDDELFKSHMLCNTNYETNRCPGGGCGKSKSCANDPTVIWCQPI